MKQILVISGKGGTGKTVITGALAALIENKILVDCDVDAADLHLLLTPQIKERHVFKSGATAFIDANKCTHCGRCMELCRFNAIKKEFVVDPIACEGCAFCSRICPSGAIEMKENISGEWYLSDTRFGPMVHARLGIAEENSGKLVSLVRQQAKALADKQKRDWVIIDGPPGIGCPVIASLSGIDLALVVTEPTLSGLHDAERVIALAKHFNVSTGIIINKFDLNIDMSGQIEEFCRETGTPVIGKIGFDEMVVSAMVEGKTIMEYPDGPTKETIQKIWDVLKTSMK